MTSWRGRRTVAAVVAALVVPVVLTPASALARAVAVGATAPSAAPPAAAPVAPALSRFPVPRLYWRACGDAFLCTSVAVPLDWSHPQGRRIALSLVKLPATDRRHRIGTLFVNPGGPGGSGVDMVRSDPESFPAAVRRRFDVVGFDPRFVGSSRPTASCLMDDAFATLTSSQPAFPLTADEVATVTQAQASYTRACAHSSDLAFASTGSVARDLDLLRQAVGDTRLTYLGYSYGTYLGEVYAQLYPGRIRAMVLDGVVDGQAWRRGTGTQWKSDPFSARIDSAAGSSLALSRFLSLCATAGRLRCALAAESDPSAAYAALADHLRTAPIDLGTGDVLGYADLVTATTGVLYSPMDWQSFAEELQALYDAMTAPPGSGQVIPFAVGPASTGVPARVGAVGRAARVRVAAAAVAARARSPRWERPPTTQPIPDPPSIPADNPVAAFDAVACEDSLNPADIADWTAAGERHDAVTPYFGRAWTWSSAACATWPFTDPNAYGGPFGARTSAPLLVVGNRYDPATPYAGAVATAARYPGARLLMVNGYGHTSGAAPSACAQAAVSAYLVTQRLPAVGTVCRQDIVPFG